MSSKNLRGRKMFADIQAMVESEGFDYYFRHYTSYANSSYDDAKLAELWAAYTKAADALEAYCGLEDA